ncbi:MAG: hypothetical protein AB7I30_17240 [Isosphaeraceae bacterium]
MPAPPIAPWDSKGLVLAIAVGLVALILLLSQELLGRRRDESDPLADPGRKSRRRSGSLLMLMTGLTMVVGSLLSPKVNGRPNFAYVAVWTLVLVEVAGLLVFAWRDLAATRRLAKALRQSLARENLALLKEESLRRPPDPSTQLEEGNGHPG